ncbi:MAG: helix-turn-helix domain-containing protein [Bacillota bacterium]
MEFGEYIKQIRKDQKLSLREVAKRAGMSHPYLSQLETGRNNNPTRETLLKLSKGLEVDYSTLLKKAGYLDEQDRFLASLDAGLIAVFHVEEVYKFVEIEYKGKKEKVIVKGGKSHRVHPGADKNFPIKFGHLDPNNEDEILKFISDFGELGREKLPIRKEVGVNMYLEEFESETLSWIQTHIKTVKYIINLFEAIKRNDAEEIIKLVREKDFELILDGISDKRYIENKKIEVNPIFYSFLIIEDILNENIKFVRRELYSFSGQMDSYFTSDRLIDIIYWQLANIIQSEGIQFKKPIV